MLPTWQPEWCSWHTGQIQTQLVQLPIFRRNLSYSNCSLQFFHPGHWCCCDLLFCHCFLPSSTHSSCAVASCVLFSPSILTFFPWKGFFSWCLFNSFKPSSHLHQTRIPGPLSEVLFFPPFFFNIYSAGTLYPSIMKQSELYPQTPETWVFRTMTLRPWSKWSEFKMGGVCCCFSLQCKIWFFFSQLKRKGLLLETMAWCAKHLLHKCEDLSGVSSIHIKAGHCGVIQEQGDGKGLLGLAGQWAWLKWQTWGSVKRPPSPKQNSSNSNKTTWRAVGEGTLR